jgi:hypothetical protein
MREHLYILNCRNHKLASVLNNGRPSAPVVILVHGFAGNKDEGGLFVDAEEYLSERGFNVLRFDAEGAGDSEGEFHLSSLRKQSDDLGSMIDYVEQQYPDSSIGMIGFSLGAAVAIIRSDPRVRAYALWSAALDPSRDMFPRYNTTEVKRDLHRDGYLLKAGLRVGPTIIEDLRATNLVPQMKSLNRPVLVVHGTEDSRIPLSSARENCKWFRHLSFREISGAQHSFKGYSHHRGTVLATTCDWLSQTLKQH